MNQINNRVPLRIGTDVSTGKTYDYLHECLIRHLWALGATGSGKTVFLVRLIAQLIRGLSHCIIVVDKMGGLSRDLEKFLASKHCPPMARERALLIRPSEEDYVFPMFPIDGNSEASPFYQVERTTDLAMRLWRSQDMSLQARLRKWSFNLLFAMLDLGLNIRPSEFLLNPRADEHEPMLRRLKGRVKHEWLEILNAKGSESVRILESARNRWSPFFECPQLRRMTSTNRNHLDLINFRQEKRIIILDLSPGLNQLTGMVANGIAGMFLNDVISSARVAASCGLSLPETVVFLDEFQDYASKDLEEALPQTRQLGLSFCFAHQSMSQLKQGEFDMTDIVWQAQSVAFFRNFGVDGDVIAQEKAIYDYDENEIKDERKVSRQKNVGHTIVITKGGGTSKTTASSHTDQTQHGASSGENTPIDTEQGKGARNRTSNDSTSASTSYSDSIAEQESWRENLVPILEDVEEVSGVTYRQFDEVYNVARRRTRQLPIGQCYFKAVNDPQFRQLQIHPLFIKETPYISDRIAEFEANNFASNLFVPAHVIDREDRQLRQQLLSGGPLDTSRQYHQPSPPKPSDNDHSSDRVFG